jgi:uncharacterized glyoxalase superfamily metalloenzyme YdcJ
VKSSGFVSPERLRALFSAALAAMYRAEVPRYADLADLVAEVDAKARLKAFGQVAAEASFNAERHGAIRVGTAQELCGLRRLFAVMGMRPVGYYDLSIAGLPVHSTAFRPIGASALQANPFRMFCSLLRLDLIEDLRLREMAASILEGRQIVSPRCLELIQRAESEGLNEVLADEFVRESLTTFRWHAEAAVSAQTYRALREAHPLIADIVSFKGPHINHLTLASLDIDVVQAEMLRRGLNPKAIIEGPPRRAFPILLRQTSFMALAEPVLFPTEDGTFDSGLHTARFGEVEQRGAALTQKGRALYDCLLAQTLGDVSPAPEGSNTELYKEALTRQFQAFPDDAGRLREEKLAFFHYSPTEKGLRHAKGPALPQAIDTLVQEGYVQAEPIPYEDFLPVSAAGIFRSNLGGAAPRTLSQGSGRTEFETALGVEVIDDMALYAEAEAQSKAASLAALGLRAERQ